MKFYKIYTSQYFVLICRILIGALFIYASIDKIFHPVTFAQTFVNYNLAPLMFAPLVAVFVPWFELFTGLMLLTGYKQRLAAFCLTGLLTAFLAGLTINVLRGFQMDCGCFEFFGMKENLDWFTVLRDVFFIFLTLPPFLAEKKFLSIDLLMEKMKNK